MAKVFKRILVALVILIGVGFFYGTMPFYISTQLGKLFKYTIKKYKV